VKTWQAASAPTSNALVRLCGMPGIAAGTPCAEPIAMRREAANEERPQGWHR